MLYFAYGSNMNEERMNERKIRFHNKSHGIFLNHSLVFNKISSKNPNTGFANVTLNYNSIVEGVIYDIIDDDINKLDKFEGYPDHYTREERNFVDVDGKKIVSATIYVATPAKTRNGLLPTKEYMSHLLKSEFLSQDYRKFLENVKTA
jgi:gamma-glutamylcyclotransferase